MLSYTYHDSPIGPLLVAGTEEALYVVSFPEGSRRREPEHGWREDAGPLAAPLRQLDEYFAGTRMIFDLVLRPRGTAFQEQVWHRLTGIPYGETTSYGAIAAALGDRSMSRAVGAANGANPIPIVIPCHRVIGANGSLTGFGGGLPVKRFLLEHEQRNGQVRDVQGRLL